MPTRGVVVDRFGNEVDDDDSDVVADGHGLRVPVRFMDSQQRMVAAATGHAVEDADDADDADDNNPYLVDDEQLEHGKDAYAARSHRLSAGMHRHRVPTPVSDDDMADSDDTDRRAAAYDAMKKRLSGAWKARRAPVPADPSWVSRVPWRPRGKYGNDAAPSDAEARRAAAYFGFKARLHSAGPQRRSLSSPPAGDAASERRAHIERLQRAFFQERRAVESSDLDARIRAAFDDSASSQAIVELIGAADAAAQAAGSEAEAARARALDPTLASEVVSAARRRMEDSAFERDRMATAVEQLRARLLVVKADEEDARRLRIYEDAKAERDRLAAELRDFYPDVAERLAELLARIAANDEAIERINAYGLPRERGRLLCAELTARNLTGWVWNSQPLARRLTDELRLPAFELRPGPDGGYLWPRSR